MQPKIVVISGVLQGETFLIEQEDSVIGRDSDWLRLSDGSASRRHCVIRKEEENFKIVDLQSRNGTFVNGVPIHERILQHGDRIEVGNSMFLFLSAEQENLHTFRTDAGSALSSTIRVRMEDSCYMNPERIDALSIPPGRIVQGLESLLRISRLINSIRNLRNLHATLIQLAFDIVPAQRGALVVPGHKSGDFDVRYAAYRKAETSQSISLNQNIVDQVFEENSAVLSNEIQEETFQDAEHIVTSLLCAPLTAGQETIGALYLDTSDPGVRFDEDHLHLISAVCAIAALAIKNCDYVEGLERENLRLKAHSNVGYGMIGDSDAIRNVCDFVARVAPTDSTVLIYGETGTGKELAARAIHRNSPRSQKPFAAINCATLSETLLESELFGHERGAFTGAVTQRKGKLELADGGTLFLDEIADTALPIQAKLLRVLQERQFERLGGTQQITVNIRLIAATNKKLEDLLRTGLFREDLFYRLNVLKLMIPPLRERVEDIPLLATHFLTKYGKKAARRIAGISADTLRYLVCYPWPGNIRELENAIERAVILGSGESILPEDLPESILDSQPSDAPPGRYQEAIRKAKRNLILKALGESRSFVEAARLLDMHPNNLHRLIRNLGLRSAIKTFEA